MYIFQIIKWTFPDDNTAESDVVHTEKLPNLSWAMTKMKDFVDAHPDSYISEGTTPSGEFEVTTEDETMSACIEWHPDNCDGEK